MATVREIASKAGVSITTVSRVLNNHPRVDPQVKDRVLQVANRARYVASAGGRGLMNVALVYVGDLSAGLLLESPYDIGLLQGMSAGMQEQGYNLMILDARREKQPSETYSQMFHRKGVRGAVLRCMSESRAICETIAEEGFPAVVVAERFDGDNVSFVDSDSRDASYDGVSRLIQLGHRRIAICLNNLADQDHADRLDSYHRAHADAGLEVDPLLTIESTASRESGRRLVRRLSSLTDPPTAVFATDPAIAIGALTEAQQMQLRVPAELSILGFDDSDARFDTFPAMAAVCQDSRRVGLEACRGVMQLINDPQHDRIALTLPTWLEMHPSVGPAP